MKLLKPDKDTSCIVEIGLAGSAPAFFTKKTTNFSRLSHFKRVYGNVATTD